MFKTILVAVDGSQGAARALDAAIALQKSFDSELLLLSVYRDHNLWKASVSWVQEETTSSTDEAMKQYAREVAEQSKAHALEQGASNVRAFYINGGPARQIIRFSKEHDADLIVLGKRGLSDSSNDLLGGVAHKVTSLAKCPVLSV